MDIQGIQTRGPYKVPLVLILGSALCFRGLWPQSPYLQSRCLEQGPHYRARAPVREMHAMVPCSQNTYSTRYLIDASNVPQGVIGNYFGLCIALRVQILISHGLWVSIQGAMHLVWAKYSLFATLDLLVRPHIPRYTQIFQKAFKKECISNHARNP